MLSGKYLWIKQRDVCFRFFRVIQYLFASEADLQVNNWSGLFTFQLYLLFSECLDVVLVLLIEPESHLWNS